MLAKPFITGAAAAATTTQDNTARTLLYSRHRQTAVQTERLSQCLFRHRSLSTLASLVFEFGYHFVYHQRPSKTFRQEEEEEEEHDEKEEEEEKAKKNNKNLSVSVSAVAAAAAAHSVYLLERTFLSLTFKLQT